MQIATLQKALRRHHGDVKWVRPESIHITLKFLGDVEEESVEEIEGVLHKSVQGFSPFSIELSDTGVFPHVHRPRVLWVGIKKGAQELGGLARKVDASLQELGFEPEKRHFSAHITLGRVRSPHGMDTTIKEMISTDFRTKSFHVESIEFMKSDLKPTGAVYTVLRHLPLQG
jgi:2'-5' RNA ligase